MAKQINVSVGGVVKKVKEVPLGVGGVLKKAKSGVAGVAGVVREFYGTALVLYDNGVTDYTWKGYATDTGSELKISAGSFSIEESIDISEFTKLGVTFIDSTVSTSTYCYGNLRLFNYNESSSIDLFDTSYPRNPGSEITMLFNLDENDMNDGDIADFDLTNFRPGFLFSLWNKDWLKSADFSGFIKKVWFE